MAITVNARAGQALRRAKLPGGLTLAPGVEITLGATADYTATGIPLSVFKNKAGFQTVHAIFGVSVRAAVGTVKAYIGIYDIANASLRLYKGATVEITAGTDLAIGDIVTMTLVGVP